MTERGLPSMDGAPACPFVAFGDDREARSTSPDHRHRCFAESPPAPRAVAHQEAYCLSSAFPVCPTFQDWARREAAQARAAGDRAPAAPPPAATPEPAPYDLYAGWAIPPQPPSAQPDLDESSEDEPGRNPPRDWAAPPPWATGAATAGALSSRSGVTPTPPAPTPPPTGPAGSAPQRPPEAQGLAGSPADRLAAGEVPAAVAWSASAGGHASTAPDEELAGLVQGRPSSSPGTPTAQGSQGSSGGHDPSVPAAALAAAAAAASTPPSHQDADEPVVRSGPEAYPPPTRTGKRPSVSSTRETISGPSWERMQHLDSYPPIKAGSSSRGGLPRVALFAGALGIAALILFMLPAIIGIGGGGTSNASPSASRPAATASRAPTAVPAPTPVVYVIKKGDTLSKVANKFDVELEDLLAANPDITDPNKVSLGQKIIIPTASTAPPPAVSQEPADSAEPS